MPYSSFIVSRESPYLTYFEFRLWIATVFFSFCSTLVRSDEPRYVEEFPQPTSKKGLQVEIVDDAIELGIQHAAFNVNLCSLLSVDKGSDSLASTYQGKTYHFHRSVVESLDARIKAVSDKGVLVYAILLAYQSGNKALDRLLIHPNCIASAPNRLGGFNTATQEGRDCLHATIEFLAERWSRPDRSCGRVVGYIAGNEVNSHWWWYNIGRVSMDDFISEYAKAVRIIHTAVRKQSSASRIYLSLEHHWTIRYAAGDDLQSFPAKEFLERFQKVVATDGDIDWHVAFHPYPENLFEPRFWLDKSATHSLETPRITFNNVEQLANFLQTPALQYEGKPRRAIFSEQGFHTPAGDDGQAIQAAAFCLAYKKIEQLDGVDAFILHRHVDNDQEGGLLLGLRSNKPNGNEARPKKMIYQCFHDADRLGWEKSFQFALPILGLKQWPTKPDE